jgi:hypothetical protein
MSLKVDEMKMRADRPSGTSRFLTLATWQNAAINSVENHQIECAAQRGSEADERHCDR